MIKRIAKLLHSGKLKPEELDQELLTKTYDELYKGARSGWGAKNWDKLQKDGDAIITEIKNNLYFFSAAKTYNQLLDFNAMLVDEDGKIRSFTEFRRKVMVVHETYNQNYLQAEYQTAKRSSQAAKQWQQFVADADLFPNLEYRTVGDQRVRDEHDKLEGVIKPINDSFWDSHYPPNGWRCRCSVRQTDAPATKHTPKVTVDRGFENNVGKSGQVFNPDGHPYFAMDEKVLKRLKKMKPDDE